MTPLSPVSPARSHLTSLGDLLKNRKNKPEIQLTTLPELNYKMWGIAPRELMCVAARTSMGKSSLALQIALDVASQKIPVLYLSLEMTVLSMLERMFCNRENVPGVEILRGNFFKYKPQWDNFCQHINNIPLILTEGQGKNWKQIDTLISKITPMPKVIILDYIQCVAGAGFEKREVIDEYIRHLREMAIENNFAAIIVSQINREGAQVEDAEPAIHQLKGSGYIEELCDKIVLCHWPWWNNKKHDKNMYRFILAKNRTGMTGTINLRYIPEYFKFEDAIEVTTPVDPRTQEVKEIFNGTVLESTRNPDGTMPILPVNGFKD